MGMLGKGLLGLLLGGSNKNSMPSYLRNAQDSYGGSRSSKVWWRCAFCGKLCQNSGLSSPSATFGGKCSNSPYGTHRYERR